jgi:hypothetical protein
MDTAVALVQAYLQVNGYFTVAEYPVLEDLRRGGTRTATDLDILAFRFPMAGRRVTEGGRRAVSPLAASPDPALGVPAETADMIVGEVKEGAARFNLAARDPMVIEAALVRFGCCPPDGVSRVVRKLLQGGRAPTPDGHVVRLVAFGSTGAEDRSRHRVVTIGHIVAFLRAHLRRNWGHLGRAQLSHPALSFLALLEKADRGASAADEAEIGERSGP